MNKNYQIIIGSPTDYNELVAYIWINGEEIAIVQKEDGSDKMKVEFYKEEIKTEISIDILIQALQKAKEELMK